MKDLELVDRLASPSRQITDEVAREILRRGARMIPHLIKLRGDARLYNGVFGAKGSASVVYGPTGNSKNDSHFLKQGKFVTLEVAALYLITAIYYQSLEIAQSPYLTDLSLPALKRKEANTRRLIERAWKSTNEWYARLKASDLEKLRAADDYPLKSSNVDFW